MDFGCCKVGQTLTSNDEQTANDLKMSATMMMHSSCGVASKCSARSMVSAPRQQTRSRSGIASFDAVRSISSVHRCAQTPLRHQKRAAVRAPKAATSAEYKARPHEFKVALLGAAGGIGQPLALLLKMNRLVGELSLYDVANVVGVAADLSHCNTPTKVCPAPHLISLMPSVYDSSACVINARQWLR